MYFENERNHGLSVTTRDGYNGMCFYILADNKCFSSLYQWKGSGDACTCVVISKPLLNAVAIKQHLISTFKLAIPNKPEPRKVGRKDMGPALEFLILGIRGEFQTNINVHLIK